MKLSIERTIYYSARSRAKQKQIPFDIELEDIIIPDMCPILGFPLNKNPTVKVDYNSCSIDRIIPELGYVKGNIQIISFRANSIKSNATFEQLVLLKEWALSQ